MNPDLMQPKYRAMYERTWQLDYEMHGNEVHAEAAARGVVWSAAVADIVAARVYEIVEA